jgi:hypothetical protein
MPFKLYGLDEKKRTLYLYLSLPLFFFQIIQRYNLDHNIPFLFEINRCT